jgi:glycosidase
MARKSAWTGGHDPGLSSPDDLGREARWDKETLAFYKQIIGIRQSVAALRRGQLTVLGQKLDADALVFLRHTDKIDEVALVAINNSTETIASDRVHAAFASLPCPADEESAESQVGSGKHGSGQPASGHPTAISGDLRPR